MDKKLETFDLKLIVFILSDIGWNFCHNISVILRAENVNTALLGQ